MRSPHSTTPTAPFIESFFESRGSGEFSLLNLSLSVELRDFGGPAAASVDLDMRLDHWLRSTAFFHELRHYHDLVGSVCGIHLFLEATELVDRFLGALASSHGKASVPFTRHAPDSSPAKIFAGYKRFFEIVLGDVPWEHMRGTLTHYPTRRFSCVQPAANGAYPLMPIHRANPFSGEWEERLVPLGLRALLEQTATELQVCLAAWGGGENRFAVPEPSDTAQRAFRLWQRLVQGDFVQYFALHMFAQFCLQANDPTKAVDDCRFVEITPPLGQVLALAQAATDLSGYAPIYHSQRGHTWEFEHPGLVFAHLAAEWRRSDRDRPALQVLSDVTSKTIGKDYVEYLALYADHVARKRDTIFPPHLLPRAARSELISLLREDVIGDHQLLVQSKVEHMADWIDPLKYVELTAILPHPPVLSVPGAPASTRSKEQTVRSLNWSMLLACVEGMAETGEIRCPVRFHNQNLGKTIVFDDPDNPNTPTTCAPFIKACRCGVFRGHYLAGQPACHFVSVVDKVLDGSDLQLNWRENDVAPDERPS